MRFFSRAFSLPITPRDGVLRALGTLRFDNGDENVKKAIGSISKTTTLHVHYSLFVHFFAVTARLRRKMPSFTIQGGRKQATTRIFFSF